MSRYQALQSADGVLERVSPDGIVQIALHAAPTDSQTGFAVGCIWQNLSGSPGSCLYVNIGSKTSSNWLNIC